MSEQQQTSEQALATLQELERKRKALIEFRAADDAARRDIAFRTHADGDKAARATLDKLNAAAARFDAELRSIEDALAVAQDNLQRARVVEAREQDKANAREVAKVVEALAEHGQVLDDALHDVVEAGANLRACLNRLHGLQVHHSSHEMLHSLGNLAIRTAMTASIWSRYFETVAPRDRKSFVDVIAAWRASLMADVARRLGETEPAKTEAAA
jgi:chromosome segregation ATPase